MINFDGANVSDRRKHDLSTFCPAGRRPAALSPFETPPFYNIAIENFRLLGRGEPGIYLNTFQMQKQ